MPDISQRSNRRLYIEQSILNNFPIDSKARWFRYSVAAQTVHPFALAIHELSVMQEKMWHNYFPSTFNTTDIDLVYHTPSFFTDVDINGFLNDVDSVPVTRTESDLDAFWYSVLPTRLSLIGTAQKQIYPTKEAKNLRLGSKYQEYIASTHITNDLFNPESAAPWNIITGTPTVQYQNSGGWGGGSHVEFILDNLPDTTVTIEATSTQIATGLDIGFYTHFNLIDENVTSGTLTVGYQGIGSSQKVFSPDLQWQEEALVYSPPSTDTVGTPFVRITADKPASSTDTLQISDFHLFDYSSIHSDTSLEYPLKNWAEQDPSFAYVVVTGGTNLLDVNTGISRAGLPSAVTIEGINVNGEYSNERVIIPHNGTHKSSKLWREITGTRVDAIYPETANVSVQLQNYQSLSGQQDYIDGYFTPYFEGALFYGIEVTSGTSFFRHESFITDSFAEMVDGYDFLVPRFKMELTDVNNDSYEIADFKIDIANRHIYTLDSNNKTISIYDPLGHWPDVSAFKRMRKESTPYPDMTIREFEDEEYILQKGNSIAIEANWRNRYKQLLQNRWTLYKPDGSVVGLDENGAEVAASSNYWISNNETTDQVTGEFRFKPQIINYIANDTGDYVITLEAQYTDENTVRPLLEKSSSIFSVVNRTPLKTFTIPTAEARTPLGLDFDSNGNIRIAYTNPVNPNIIDEEIFSTHYDYFFEDTDNKRFYFREDYKKIVITRSEDTVSTCARTVTIINNTDSLLTTTDVDCGFIFTLTGTQAVQLTLPAVDGTQDGYHMIVKRYGSNLVTLVPDAGDTIDGNSSHILSIDKDSITLTYVHSQNMWAIS